MDLHLKVKCHYTPELIKRLTARPGVKIIGAYCLECADKNCVYQPPKGWTWKTEEVGMARDTGEPSLFGG